MGSVPLWFIIFGLGLEVAQTNEGQTPSGYTLFTALKTAFVMSLYVSVLMFLAFFVGGLVGLPPEKFQRWLREVPLFTVVSFLVLLFVLTAWFAIGLPAEFRREILLLRAFGIDTERHGKEIVRMTTVRIADPANALDECEKFITSTFRIRALVRSDDLLRARVRLPGSPRWFSELGIELDRRRGLLRCTTRSRCSWMDPRSEAGSGLVVLPIIVSWTEGRTLPVRMFFQDTLRGVFEAARERPPRSLPEDS